MQSDLSLGCQPMKRALRPAPSCRSNGILLLIPWHADPAGEVFDQKQDDNVVLHTNWPTEILQARNRLRTEGARGDD